MVDTQLLKITSAKSGCHYMPKFRHNVLGMKYSNTEFLTQVCFEFKHLHLIVHYQKLSVKETVPVKLPTFCVMSRSVKDYR